MPSSQSGCRESYCRIPGDVGTVLGPSSESHNILLNGDSVLANPSQIRISLWGWWWPLEDGTECLPEALAGYFWQGKSLSTFVDSHWSVNSLSLSHIPAQFTASPSSEIPLFWQSIMPSLYFKSCHLLMRWCAGCWTAFRDAVLGKPQPQVVSWAHGNTEHTALYFLSSLVDLSYLI